MINVPACVFSQHSGLCTQTQLLDGFFLNGVTVWLQKWRLRKGCQDGDRLWTKLSRCTEWVKLRMRRAVPSSLFHIRSTTVMHTYSQQTSLSIAAVLQLGVTGCDRGGGPCGPLLLCGSRQFSSLILHWLWSLTLYEFLMHAVQG